MKFAIIGSGNVGTSIARGVTGAGHDVVVAGPSEDGLTTVAAKAPVQTTTSNREAVTGVDAVFLAVPFAAVEGIVTELRDDLAGKIVVDVTNPLAPDLSGLAANGASAAELVAQAAPDARVVKAFNTVFAANQADPSVDGLQLDGFVARDDDQAKQVVLGLLGQIGFRPIDVGPPSASRYLEGMALINIALNAHNG